MFCNPYCLILLLLILQGNCGQRNCNCVINRCGHKHRCNHGNRGNCGSVNIYPKKVKIYINCHD